MNHKRILLTTLLPLIGIACSQEPQVESSAPTEATTPAQAAPHAADLKKNGGISSIDLSATN